MLVIKNNLSVQQILQELKELSRYKEDLKILIESFPDSLESEIGLDHFLYMLSNYPRQIIWISDNDEIFDRLRSKNLNTQRFHSFSSKTDRILEEIDRLSSTDNQNKYELKLNQSAIPSFNLESTFLNPDHNRRALSVNPIFDQIPSQIKGKSPEIQNLVETDQLSASTNDSHFVDLSGIDPKANLITKDDVFVSTTTNGVSMQNENPPILDLTPQNTLKTKSLDFRALKDTVIEQKVESPALSEVLPISVNEKEYENPKSPEFNKMRSKILASKAVLQSINQPHSTPDQQLNQLVTNQFEHVFSLTQDQNLESEKLETNNKKTNNIKSVNDAPSLSEIKHSFWSPLRYLYLLLFSLITILSMVAVALGFPSVAYTIQITPEKKESDAIFSFDRKQINTQNFKFNLSASTDTTGTVSTSSTRAKGKVRLLNKTGNNIELTLSKFYLNKNDNRYNPVFDSTQTPTINIPSKNHLSGPIVEIEVESGNIEKSGNYGLNEGEELTPVNLQGVPLGPNFSAVVSQAITSNESKSNRTVTDGDLRTLRSTIESNLLKNKQDKLTEIDSKKYISNINWSTNIESEFNTDHKLGDPADSVSISATVSSDIYYLDKKILVDQILARESTAEQVTKIEISNAETAWNKDAQKLDLEVKYIFALKSDISKEKLREIAQSSGLDVNQASNKIKQAYPRVSDVKTSISGVPVPINPHIEVEVIQNINGE